MNYINTTYFSKSQLDIFSIYCLYIYLKYAEKQHSIL